MNLIKEFITLDAYSFALSHPATLNPITIYYYFQSRHVSKRESRGGAYTPPKILADQKASPAAVVRRLASRPLPHILRLLMPAEVSNSE